MTQSSDNKMLQCFASVFKHTKGPYPQVDWDAVAKEIGQKYTRNARPAFKNYQQKVIDIYGVKEEATDESPNDSKATTPVKTATPKKTTTKNKRKRTESEDNEGVDGEEAKAAKPKFTKQSAKTRKGQGKGAKEDENDEDPGNDEMNAVKEENED